ncbi:2-dehydropantoate 2-reductase [Ideonella sp. BN130291]|uniref:2-dehydropantoate 2-reductase n=1 Tax=Ideonella sp. BN130291 TaxID=3112940 RepID=UPI002E2611D8|nr:2-dehydropantoate 2-reductase [Ideonella sp. BN130291]
MKVCVVGAGAIGGLIGARLALAGVAEVSALARGATLLALQAHGWRLQGGGELRSCPARASDDPQALGPQDLVVIAVKGPALTDVARRIAPLIGPQTVVLPAMNGVPWWFGPGLDSVDPGGVVAAAIATEQVIGCVVHASAKTSQPGLVEHQRGLGLIIGEPAGGVSARVTRIGELLSAAGFELTLSAQIRNDIWYKLWGNLSTNPVSALTGATADRIIEDPLVSSFCIAAMAEAKAVGERIGIHLPQTPAERHEVTRKLGAFKTSMLQDLEAGRPLELDAIVGAVRELGAQVGVATPNIDALFGLTRLLGRVRGLYPAEPA